MLLLNQIRIKNTKNYYQYLKDNSNWIKELNRSINNFNKFNEFIKDRYELRIGNKISNIVDNIDTINNVLNILK